MPLKDEIEMLNMSISITKQKIPSCNNKRERLLLQDRLACLKAELTHLIGRTVIFTPRVISQ